MDPEDFFQVEPFEPFEPPEIKQPVLPDLQPQEFGQVTRKSDGSYVITQGGMPYHVPPDSPQYNDVSCYILDHQDMVTDEPPTEPPDREEAMEVKRLEIREAALAEGRKGTTIDTGTATYHMAITAEDVGLLQQANMVAKMAWDLAGFPADSPYRVAELKEKWMEDGVERTRLHPNVPERDHNIVLAFAALQAREILLKQEMLIQAIQDAATIEDVLAITWDFDP